MEERNRLIEQIDDALPLCSSSTIASLGYNPAKMNADELREVLARINAHLDKQ